MNKLKFYIISTPSSYWILPVYAYQFNKYVPNMECVVMCYEYPEDIDLPDNFTIVSISNGKSQGGVNNWASSIRKYLERIDDEYIIFSLDDFLITDPMNVQQFRQDLKDIKKYDIKRYSLGNSKCRYYSFEKWNDFLKFSPNSRYRISTQVSVWNKDYLIKFLKDGWTPWNFEIDGSNLSKNLNDILVYKETPILKYIESGALSRRYGGKINVKGISDTDINFHENNGNFKGKSTFHFN